MIGGNKQTGVGLIEVMVTVLILGSSLLALGAMQNRSLQFNHSAYLRSQANVMAYDILDRIRINREEMASYNHALGDGAPTGNSVRATDLREWVTSIERNLPGGAGGVECANSTKICTVSVRWIDDDRQSSEINDDSQQTTTFTYSTRI